MTATLTADTATGTIAGHTTQFTPLHRDGNTTPVQFQMTATMPLSYEDIVAAVWVLACDGFDLADMPTDTSDPFNIYRLVMTTVMTNNSGMADALYEVQDIRPGTEHHVILTDIRALVTAAFGREVAR
jgi:hypothetical protein